MRSGGGDPAGRCGWLGRDVPVGKEGLIQPIRKLIGLEIAVIDRFRCDRHQFHPEISIEGSKLLGHRRLVGGIAPHGQHRSNPPEAILLPEDKDIENLPYYELTRASAIKFLEGELQ
jgi:hypothetical protein